MTVDIWFITQMTTTDGRTIVSAGKQATIDILPSTTTIAVVVLRHKTKHLIAIQYQMANVAK